MRKFKFKELLNLTNLRHLLVFAATFIITYLILMPSPIAQKYDLKEGDIAKVNIKAPREVEDVLSTEERITQATKDIPQQYNKKPEVETEALQNVENIFSKIMYIKEGTADDKSKIEQLKSNIDLKLGDNDYVTLSKLSTDDVKALQSTTLDIISQVFDNNNIMQNNEEDIKRAQGYVLLKINDLKLQEAQKTLITELCYSQIKPNFFYDEVKTEELKKEEIKKIPPIMIKKDQLIVKESEPVTKEQIAILKSLGLLSNSGINWKIYISLGVLIFVALFVQWSYLYKYNNEIYNDISKLILINILNCIALIFARTLSIISPNLIPLACIPMLLTLLIDDKVSMTISLINSVLISAVVGFNIEITLLAMLNSVLGAIILRKLQQRNDIWYSSLYIGAISSVTALAIGFLLTDSAPDVVRGAGLSLVAGILSGILTIGFLPFFESTFDIITTIKLLELSNPNHPLLKKLLMEAPGTYHHSILVGNLSEVAAEAVGGNPVLARVASYYHDVGKIKRPYFFKENQIGGDNPHDKITPNLSTLIITSHVKDGLELAKEYRIPGIIQDAIEQHHGTSLVKYFYIMMKNSSEKPEEIDEEDFRYLGPIPSTKEIGVIMLADSVEAAVRSISEPSKGKIEAMVNNIIKSRLNEGQLNNCDLTLKDLDKIRKAFLKVLSGIYHNRIEYPEDNSKLIK